MLPTYRRHTIANRALPVWMAALLAAECQVTGNGFARRVDWRCRSGRAMYTNLGARRRSSTPSGSRYGAARR